MTIVVWALKVPDLHRFGMSSLAGWLAILHTCRQEQAGRLCAIAIESSTWWRNCASVLYLKATARDRHGLGARRQMGWLACKEVGQAGCLAWCFFKEARPHALLVLASLLGKLNATSLLELLARQISRVCLLVSSRKLVA